jgi:hypothetical protein
MERYEREKFAAEQDRFLHTMSRSFFVRAIFTPTLEIMAAVGIAATVVFAARAVAAGDLQPDRVISFLATIVLLYTPLKSLGGTGQGVTQGLAGARRLWEILDEPVEPVSGGAELPPFAGEVRFERVSFRYRADGPAVLRSVDLSLRRGEVDVYPDYTGTLALEILGARTPLEGAALEAALAAQGVAVSRPLGFEDRYAVGVPRALAFFRESGCFFIPPRLRGGSASIFKMRAGGGVLYLHPHPAR